MGASTEMSSTMLSCQSSSSNFLKQKQKLTESKMSEISSNVDFSQYVSQMQTSNSGMWKSASTPSLPKMPDKKKFPGLPQLVKAKKESQSGNTSIAGSTAATMSQSQVDLAFAARWNKKRSSAATDSFAGYRGVKWREPTLAHLS